MISPLGGSGTDYAAGDPIEDWSIDKSCRKNLHLNKLTKTNETQTE